MVYDEQGKLTEVLVTYDENTKSGSNFNERKPNGTIQYVSMKHAIPAQFNYFEDLIVETDANKDLNVLEKFNQDSWIKKRRFC